MNPQNPPLNPRPNPRPRPSQFFSVLIAFFVSAELTFIQVKYTGATQSPFSHSNPFPIESEVALTVYVVSLFLETVFDDNVFLQRFFSLTAGLFGSMGMITLLFAISKALAWIVAVLWSIMSLLAALRCGFYLRRYYQTHAFNFTIEAFLNWMRNDEGDEEAGAAGH